MTNETKIQDLIAKFIYKYTKPFHFIIEQPLYITLSQLCIIQIIGVIVSFYMMFDLLAFYKTNIKELDGNNVTAIFAFNGTIFATIWVSLNSIYKVGTLPNSQA